MLDLHTHILPAIDDGAQTLDTSCAMAQAAVNDGVRVLAATPHASAWERRLELVPLLDELRSELSRRGIELELVPGAEIALSSGVARLLADGELPTLNGTRYALIELAGEVAPPNLDHQLFELQLAGFTPVLAHVERYRYVQDAPMRLDGWCERGVVLQVTAGSLRGEFGRRAQRSAEMIVRSRMAAILASDAHDAERRQPLLGAVRRLTAVLAGDQRARELVELGPAAIVAGRPFPTPAPMLRADADTGPLARTFSRLRRALGRYSG